MQDLPSLEKCALNKFDLGLDVQPTGSIFSTYESLSCLLLTISHTKFTVLLRKFYAKMKDF